MLCWTNSTITFDFIRSWYDVMRYKRLFLSHANSSKGSKDFGLYWTIMAITTMIDFKLYLFVNVMIPFGYSNVSQKYFELQSSDCSEFDSCSSKHSTERKIFIRSDKTKTALDSNVTALVSHCLAQHKSLTIYPTTTTGYVQLLSFVAFHWFYSMNIILIRPFIRRPVAAAAARLAIYWWRCTFADHICSDSISNSTFLEMIKRWLCA